MSSWFTHRVRVRMEETDALGVVYYGRYFGTPGSRPNCLRGGKLVFVAAEASCRYRESAKFDDLLSLRARVEKMGSASITCSHEVRRGRATIAVGRGTHVLVESGKPARIPGDIRAMLARFGC